MTLLPAAALAFAAADACGGKPSGKPYPLGPSPSAGFTNRI